MKIEWVLPWPIPNPPTNQTTLAQANNNRQFLIVLVILKQKQHSLVDRFDIFLCHL